MVTETRTIDLAAGTSRVIFHGVAAAIVPQTAAIEGLPAVVLESNFDYDLLTPGAVIAKSHGARVQLVRTDAATGRVKTRDAVIRAGPEGVLLDIDGKIEALGCSGLTEKLVFEHIPEGLTDEPTLSMTVRADTAGRHMIKLSYLALRLDWTASYIATLNPDGRSMGVVGWLTLVNGVSTTFANAPTQVVAGRLTRDRKETRPPRATTISESPSCWPIGLFVLPGAIELPASAPLQHYAGRDGLLEIVVTAQKRTDVVEAVQSELGDYKLYTLPEPTTVAARQTKQVAFLSLDDARFERVYQFRLDEGALEGLLGGDDVAAPPPNVVLRFENKQNRGLGKPLPAGSMIVIEPVPGRPAVFVGEHRIDDTPVGLPFDVELGSATNVWVEPRMIEEETSRSETGEKRATVEVAIGNGKPVPVVVEYRQPMQIDDAGVRIVKVSRGHTLEDGDALWTVRLSPGQRVTLRYTMEPAEI